MAITVHVLVTLSRLVSWEKRRLRASMVQPTASVVMKVERGYMPISGIPVLAITIAMTVPRR